MINFKNKKIHPSKGHFSNLWTEKTAQIKENTLAIILLEFFCQSKIT